MTTEKVNDTLKGAATIWQLLFGSDVAGSEAQLNAGSVLIVQEL